MSFVRSGACPKCGAPIWSPVVWQSITTPPPNHFTCNCVEQVVVVKTNVPQEINKSGIMAIINDLQKKVEELTNRISNLEPKRETKILKD